MKAAENFKAMLDPEELRLFEENYEKDNDKWHNAYNAEWKKAKKKSGVDKYQEEENKVRWKNAEKKFGR